eukprot:m.64540 g.64540  ORF g.64540 m.64540 type:complete len:280 (+) comp8232_c0_seq1:48-887(+)
MHVLRDASGDVRQRHFLHSSFMHCDLHSTLTTHDRYGPWTWENITTITPGINPGALLYTDETTNKLVYSVWVNGDIYVASEPSGPFKIVGQSGQRVNASPLRYNGTFFATGSKGDIIMSAPSLVGPWTNFSSIDKGSGGGEDPFLWVDARGHWHALYHASGGNFTHCAANRVSAHVFSLDGLTWHTLATLRNTTINVSPYLPVVPWADGVQDYSTLERPHVYFDTNGRMTHLGVAGDLTNGDAGCIHAKNCFPKRDQGHCPCVNCKYTGHTGTLLIELA